MELHELRVGNHRAGSGGNGDAFAARFTRVGGDGIELAGAACRQHDSRGFKDQCRHQRSGIHGAKLDAGHPAFVGHEPASGIALQNLN
jgi:hypothetical protein